LSLWPDVVCTVSACKDSSLLKGGHRVELNTSFFGSLALASTSASAPPVRETIPESVGWLMLLLVPLVLGTCVVALVVYVARDARARGTSPLMALVVFLGPVGFLLYLAIRPQGRLTACVSCDAKRLPSNHGCWRCGATPV
jgi:hypothetical protein